MSEYRAWNGEWFEGDPPEGWVELEGRLWPPDAVGMAKSQGRDRRVAIAVLGFLVVVFFAAEVWTDGDARDLRATELLLLWSIVSVPVGVAIGTGVVMGAKGYDSAKWGLLGLVIPVLGFLAALGMPRRVRRGVPPLPNLAPGSTGLVSWPAPAAAAEPAPVRRVVSPVPPPAPAAPVPPPAPAPVGRRSGGSWWSRQGPILQGGLAGLGLAVVLIAGVLGWTVLRDGGGSVEVAGVQVTTSVPAEDEGQVIVDSASDEEPESTTTLVEAAPVGESGLPTEDAEVLAFGQLHERAVGFSGAGWNISIDETRPGELSTIFDTEGLTGCTVVIGTAVLREWEGDELTSNPFSFPAINVIDEDAKVDSDVARCEVGPLRDEGLVWRLDVSVVEGAEVRWFDAFPTAVSGEYQAVAVEQTIYTPSGS